ncbi:MAG: hypothetical protein LBE60_15545 [Microbacterium sp.]|jgi:hypothetical protein|uniref:hypothetical protein n=1 Tax=Microbacterium sp. TaxID=51671 RepID=UPI002820449F|nr:hypothetical protein [Microbacterium sp.]MDR2323048.1 hypothetical protein [Microbacterium sp.]
MTTRCQNVRALAPVLEQSEEYRQADATLRRTSLRRSPALLGIALIFLGCVYVATNQRAHPAERLMMLLHGVTILMFIPIIGSAFRTLRLNRIRCAQRGPLRLLPSVTVPLVTVLWTLVVAAAGVIGIIALFLPNPLPHGVGRLSPVALIPLGIAFLGYLISRARLPRGLSVAPGGLTWTEGRTPMRFEWNSIGAVSLATNARGGRCIRIHTTSGTRHDLAAGLLGSDPAVVGEVVQHFLDHPEERELLHDPDAALARVVTPVSPSRRTQGPTPVRQRRSDS